MAPNNITQLDEKVDLETAIWRIGPSMARVTAETAGAFIATEAVLGSDWTIIPRLPDLGTLRCSQKNIGEKHEMIINLSVEKSEWDRLFNTGEGEDFRLDAFCEMANCICGSLIADSAFTDEFGYLIPCVPYAGQSKSPKGGRSYRGAFRLGAAWVHFSITVHEATGILAPSAMLVA